MDYRQEMKELRDTLNAHGYRYYVLDEPTISDYEYDHMLRRLEDLEAAHPEEITPDSPTQRIGGRTLSEFQQVTHPVPLESLQDVFDDDEVCQFLEKIPLDAPVWSVEPKVDGLSVALEYRDGVFVRGATRGDGRVGEDVTENLRTIRSIPMTLPEKLPRLIVRGEVYMARSVFDEINARRELEGKPLMANPRNAAAGTPRPSTIWRPSISRSFRTGSYPKPPIFWRRSPRWATVGSVSPSTSTARSLSWTTWRSARCLAVLPSVPAGPSPTSTRQRPRRRCSAISWCR